MCIFYKIPITFKFPIAAAAHLLQYSNIYHVKIYEYTRDDTNVNDIEWLGGTKDLENTYYMPDHDW